MSGQSSNSGAQNARDSLASIFSSYENHTPADQAHEFVKRIPSGEIQTGVRKGDIPSEEQGDELKKASNEALKTPDAMDNLSNAEKDSMTQYKPVFARKRNDKEANGSMGRIELRRTYDHIICHTVFTYIQHNHSFASVTLK